METTTTKTVNKMLKMFSVLKTKHPDAVILFRAGDFYESFFDDAKKVTEVIGIAGFPYHALDTYLPKLIRAGIRVAICDDISDSDKLMAFPIAEDADAEEIKTEEPQQEEEEQPTEIKTAKIVYPDKETEDYTPKSGTTFELEELQEVVGGYIELVRLNDGRVIVVNEEGLLQGLPVNIEATNILRRDHSTTQYIVGTAIVCDADMVD